jgi:nucleotide-binding universal stress UspA family protein
MEAKMIRIQRIVCPVDFFPASLRAVDYAITLANNYEADLHLVHVVSPVLYSTEQYALNVSEIMDGLEKASAQKMKKLEMKARAAGATVTTSIRTGDVTCGISAAIDATKPDIVVMGTHGRRGLEKLFLGSVTEYFVRRLPIPVLTVRGRRRSRRLRRILVTTDFSKGTPEALNYALSIAKENQARVILLHVLEEMRALTSKNYRAELAKRVEPKLLALVPHAARKGCDIQIRIEAGTAYSEVLTVIKRERIDLIVMSTHGKSMLDRALLGSTADRVARAAECPVMLVPPMKVAKTNSHRPKRAA